MAGLVSSSEITWPVLAAGLVGNAVVPGADLFPLSVYVTLSEVGVALLAGSIQHVSHFEMHNGWLFKVLIAITSFKLAMAAASSLWHAYLSQ